MREFDAIVVGAGPAGSTAARYLADLGHSVLLADKARFPRQKVCAAWLSVHAFAAFPYLEAHRADLLESDFYGVCFYSPDLARQVSYRRAEPAGFLSTRLKMDAVLKDIAVRAGAEFREGCALIRLEQEAARVVVDFSDGSRAAAAVLIGADGAGSAVARLSGLRRGWEPRQICACINEDIPYLRLRLDNFYGPKRVIHVVPLYRGIQGYGWVFPKRTHVCIGLGGRPDGPVALRPLLESFLEELKERRLVPGDLKLQQPLKGTDPAGAMNSSIDTGRGRVLLAGDAAGFASGSTGEGIYPGMLGARAAALEIDRALRAGSVNTLAASYRRRWMRELHGFRSAGPEVRKDFGTRYERVFRSKLARTVAGRAFLFGERIGLRTVLRALLE